MDRAFPDRLGRSAWMLSLSAILLVMLAAYPVLMQNGWLATHVQASWWCVVVWIVGYASIILSDARGLWSPAAIYFVIFAFFHFGLAATVLLGGTYEDITWFMDPEVPYAFSLVGLGGIGLALGSLGPAVVRIVVYRRGDFSAEVQPFLSEELSFRYAIFARLLAAISSTLAIFCIVAWILMTIIATGGRLFGLRYGEFLAATEGYPRPWITFGLAFGVSLAAVDLTQRAAKWAMACFLGWMLIALPIGLRGAVMFPAAGALAAQGWKLMRYRAWYFLLGGLMVFCLASALREIRQEGLADTAWRWDMANPAHTMRELGESLRPTYETVRWINDGDRYLAGESFWAPLERGFLRLFAINKRDATDEERQLIEMVDKRVGPIGFSPVAEAFYNFGAVGVVIVMGLIGAVLALLGMGRSSVLGRALMIATLLPLLVFVRNSFAQVPGQMVVTWSVVLGVWFLAGIIAARLSPFGVSLSERR